MAQQISGFDSFDGEDDDRILVYDGEDAVGRAVYLHEGDDIHVPIGSVARVNRHTATPWEATPSDGSISYEKRTLEAAARRLYDHYRHKDFNS